MKRLMLFVLAAQCLYSYGQRRSTNVIATDKGPFYVDRDLSAPAAAFINQSTKDIKRNYKVEGSAFLHDAWNTGYVKLDNDRVAQNQQLRYNVYSNEIYFLKDSQALVLTTPVKEFGYSFTTPIGLQKMIFFRNGYKRIDKNTEATFYEVLVDKPLTLLKQHSKKLLEVTSATGVRSYRVEDTETYYVYDEKKKFLYKIKRDLSSVSDALPQRTEKINQVATEKNLKFKTDEELIVLFEALNE